jgi:thiol-disulfide isomerase/thioredoxin
MLRSLLCSLIALAIVSLVSAVACAGDKAKPAPGGSEPIVINGELTEKDPADKRTNNPSKLHKLQLSAGKAYRIDMASKDFDTFLRLEDPSGKEIAFNDDISEQDLNSRILQKITTPGEYRIIATTFKGTGKYTLTIREAGAIEAVLGRMQDLPKLPAGEQEALLGELKKAVAQNGTKVQASEAAMVMSLAIDLEFSDHEKLAARIYGDFGKLFASSTDPDVSRAGRTLEGGDRRYKLPGNPIVVHGQTLDGKQLDWKAYKGKVVLVDFWATWCGPCRAEIPNMKKLYEAYHDRGFEVVAISIDRGKDAPVKYMQAEKLPWVCLFDPQPGKNLQPLAEYYGIFSIPRAILVDREGRVISMNARGEELARLLAKHIGPAEKSSK